jgi:hypothetical protein
MKRAVSKLDRLIARVPRFMHPELDRVETLADLEFQIAHEIDLTDDGTVRWTPAQLHRAKMFYSDVRIAVIEGPNGD